jgi:hypothetical protein
MSLMRGTDEFTIPQSWAVRPSILSAVRTSHAAHLLVNCICAPGPENCGYAPKLISGIPISKPDVKVQFSPLMSWTMQLPGQVRSVGTTSAFAGSGRREAQHMLGSIMPQIVATEPSEHDTVRRGKACGANLR